MSSTPNNPYLVKSMNGAITIDDGGGTQISNGNITTNSLSLNNILASSTATAYTLWSNVVSGIIKIGSQTQSGLNVLIGKNIVIRDDGIYSNSGTLINIGTVSGVILGSSLDPVRTSYTAIADTDITNRLYVITYVVSYVAGIIANFLTLSNIWTGTTNTFNNTVKTNILSSITDGATLNIGTNIVGGTLNLGGLTNVARISGVKITNNVIDTHLLTTLSIGPTNATELTLGKSAIPVRTPYNAIAGTDILNYQTGLTMTNSLLTNARNEWTGALNEFDQEIKNNNLQSAIETGTMLIGTGLIAGGSLALGSYASTIKLGGYQLVDNGLDMTADAVSKTMNIGFATATAVAIGSATIPVIVAYNATQTTQAVNYQTMTNKCPFLTSANTFTGNNTFTNLTANEINCNDYQAKTGVAVLNLGTLTLGQLNIGSLSSGINFGSLTSPVRSGYNAISGTDVINFTTLANKCPLLTGNNTYTGTNSFNSINSNEYQSGIGAVNLLTTTSGDITIGSNSTKINVGSNATTIELSNVKILGNSLSLKTAGTLTLGGTGDSIRTACIPTVATDITNKTYVDDSITTSKNNLLASANTWSLTNSFITINSDYVTAKTTNGTLNVANNLLSTGTLNLGNTVNTNNIGGLKIINTAIDTINDTFLDIGTGNTTVVNLGSSVNPVRTEADAISGSDVVNFRTMISNCVTESGNNIFTGTNTFNTVYGNDFQANTATTVNFGTNATDINLGGSLVPVRSAYNAVGGDDLVNYRTMSGSSVLLVANNEFTGTYNSFTGELRTANYQAKTTSGNLNLGTLTSGEINIGGSSQVKLNSYGIVLTSNNTRISKRGSNGFFLVTDGTGSTNTYMDFFSSGFDIYSSRIISNGGTSTGLRGTLDILSGAINIASKNGDVNLTSTANINITPVGNTLISSVNTFIKSTNLIIGQNPELYNATNGTLIPSGMRITNVAGNCIIDFHSNTVNGTNYDSRIKATGGTAVEKKGLLALEAGELELGTTSSRIQIGRASVSTDYTSISLGSLQVGKQSISVLDGFDGSFYLGSTAYNIEIGSTSYTEGVSIGPKYDCNNFIGKLFIKNNCLDATYTATPGAESYPKLRLGTLLTTTSIDIGRENIPIIIGSLTNHNTFGGLRIIGSSIYPNPVNSTLSLGTTNATYVDIGSSTTYLTNINSNYTRINKRGNNCVEVITDGTGANTNTYMNFVSSGSSGVADSRILSYGGNGSFGGAIMVITALNTRFESGQNGGGGVVFHGGIGFGKGNLTGNQFIQNGTFSSTAHLAGLSRNTIPITYPSGFNIYGTLPHIMVCGQSGSVMGSKMLYTVGNVTLSTCTIVVYNTTSVSTAGQDWGFSWTATGPY